MKIILISFLLIFSAEIYSQSIGAEIASVSRAKVGAEDSVSKNPYREEQYVDFSAYFGMIGEFIDKMNGSDNINNSLQEYIASIGVRKFCEQVILRHEKWKTLMRNCTKNRFFLCPEEIRAFDSYKGSLKRLLTAEQQDEFIKIAQCK